MSLELKDMNYIDIVRVLFEDHKDISKSTITDIADKIIRWKVARQDRFSQ